MALRDIPNADDLREKYPSNSYSQQIDEPKQIRQVASGKAHRQGLLHRLGKYIVEDSIQSAKERAFGEIIVPGFKNLIFDTLTEFLNVTLFGMNTANYRSGTNIARRADRTSYSDYYKRKNNNQYRQPETRELPMDPDDVIVSSRQEAYAVLDEVTNIIRKYGQASVADFYDVVGITSDWTDNRYGWTDIRGAGIRPVREGFMLVMPRTQVLDN